MCVCVCNRFLQGSYAGAEAMLNDTLTGAEERNEPLVEVGYALGVLAGALKEQAGVKKMFQTSHCTSSEHWLYFLEIDILKCQPTVLSCAGKVRGGGPPLPESYRRHGESSWPRPLECCDMPPQQGAAFGRTGML